ncbi:MAG TPA: hypothetical protein DIU09_05070, partial [Hyphomonadaceae bacterium]|nr:hypothetical protein [Hyphomonadaceae bacterium]
MRALVTFSLALVLASSAWAKSLPPPGPHQPLVGARMEKPELSARTIVERATAHAGGESWRRPTTLYLEGYGTFYAPDGTPLINESHKMWRGYPEF